MFSIMHVLILCIYFTFAQNNIYLEKSCVFGPYIYMSYLESCSTPELGNDLLL